MNAITTCVAAHFGFLVLAELSKGKPDGRMYRVASGRTRQMLEAQPFPAAEFKQWLPKMRARLRKAREKRQRGA